MGEETGKQGKWGRLERGMPGGHREEGWSGDGEDGRVCPAGIGEKGVGGFFRLSRGTC